MAATKTYEIADGVSITSKGVVLAEGQEVSTDDFASEAVLDALVTAGKIVEVTKGSTGTSGGRKTASKKAAAPTSATGAAEPEAEDTTPPEDTGDAGDGKAE